jgi:hypothetical protein
VAEVGEQLVRRAVAVLTITTGHAGGRGRAGGAPEPTGARSSSTSSPSWSTARSLLVGDVQLRVGQGDLARASAELGALVARLPFASGYAGYRRRLFAVDVPLGAPGVVAAGEVLTALT